MARNEAPANPEEGPATATPRSQANRASRRLHHISGEQMKTR
jgi:hypothetical protein